MFLIVSVFLFSSCQNDPDIADSRPDNNDIGIERITLNGSDYAIGSDFMPAGGSPLTIIGSLSASGRIEVEFVWNRTDEVLSSVSAACGNPAARIDVQQESVNELWRKYTLTISTDVPKADVIYRISALKELPSGE